ncbi:exodeoxyribonuclease III [Rhizobium sp. C1]|uniref:exodeoxyribonuclease III n=1 Tax=Rhizobium sp. C1 TaxID=1349799 RepID=UPI001E408E26|nr:exodeoxyribonuclease III [Rhizobium sp. C1]MCD2178459.1 exodeoxyribonuclease III [Rhizobium sp. C1]
MTFTLATWNINSVRLRMPIVGEFLTRFQPDILCLQEIKCRDEEFPYEAFRALGYVHMCVSGQKGYHGVATVSKAKIDIDETRDFCGVGDKRHLSVDFEHAGRNIRLHNFYVPAGGDEPDRTINPKFGHKLDFIAEMRAMRALDGSGRSSILVGDLNIAPLEHDVWSHKQLLKIVSHTPVETDGLKAVIAEGGWSDLMREKFPEPQKLYTWWSYRAKDWDAADKGRRLDHIWSSPDLAPHVTDIEILREARGWTQPSDHVPVIARFAF